MADKLLRDNDHVFFRCPGCNGRPHMVRIGSDGKPGVRPWGWNQSMTTPTFNPSILITYNGHDAGVGNAPPAVCHSFVRDGRIDFCADSTHALSGQTVDLPDWEPRS